MASLPPDDDSFELNPPDAPERYQPTEEDWAEYREWMEKHRSECCPEHNHQDPFTPCPDCEEQAWADAQRHAREVEDGELDFCDADPATDWWYTDLLMQASHGTFDPHCGWRAEQ